MNQDSRRLLKVSVAMDSREIHPSDQRKKLDCVNPIENVLWSESSGNHKQGSKCDLRKSLAWDSAFFTSPGVLDVEELFASLDLRDNDFEFDVKGTCTNPSTSNETNGRRSLAWNSAFFTDQGVLNAEELCLLNSGMGKTRAQKLPDARKQLWKSVDSGSTSHGSRYSVTSIESDLFRDLRTALHGSTALSASERREGMQELQCTRESDAGSADKKLKLLPPPGRKRTNNVPRQKRVMKEPSRLNLQSKRVVCSGESTPSPCKKSDKFMCGFDATVSVSMNKPPSPLEDVKPKNTSSGSETGRSLRTLRNRCSEEQSGSTPMRSWCTTGFRKVIDSRLTASDSSFKTPSRFASDSRDSKKGRKTPIKPTTPLSDIAVKDVRSSGLKVPPPKIGFFDSDNAEKENREPNSISSSGSASRRRYRKLPQMVSPEGRPLPLGRRKPAMLSANANANAKAKCSKNWD